MPISNTSSPVLNEPHSVETRADIIVPVVVVPVVGLGAVVVELIIRLKKAKEAKSRVAQLNNPTHTSPYQSIASSLTPTTSKLASQSNRLIS
jgi:hypothetical protein